MSGSHFQGTLVVFRNYGNVVYVTSYGSKAEATQEFVVQRDYLRLACTRSVLRNENSSLARAAKLMP